VNKSKLAAKQRLMLDFNAFNCRSPPEQIPPSSVRTWFDYSQAGAG
jgi:hypothetical protein